MRRADGGHARREPSGLGEPERCLAKRNTARFDFSSVDLSHSFG